MENRKIETQHRRWDGTCPDEYLKYFILVFRSRYLMYFDLAVIFLKKTSPTYAVKKYFEMFVLRQIWQSIYWIATREEE